MKLQNYCKLNKIQTRGCSPCCLLLSLSHVVTPLSFKCLLLSPLLCPLLNAWIGFCYYYHVPLLNYSAILLPPLRFLHQLQVLSNKETAFALNEESKLLSSLFISKVSDSVSSFFPPNSAAFLHVPVSLGRAELANRLQKWHRI